jgi:hypothetical protein
MMGALRISETSVCYNETTRRNIPEGSDLHTIFLLSLFTWAAKTWPEKKA